MKNKDSGTYLIIIKNNETQSITIGKLGNFVFPKGYYVYVGSAMRNLQKRISRHLSKDKKFHWHIDYLLAKVKIIFLHFMNLKLKSNVN